MQVLVALAEQPGEVISKQQLITSVWDDRPVGDDVITRCISLLRSLFGDEPKNPKYIKTLPKLGYQLLVKPRDLTTNVDAAQTDSTQGSKDRTLRRSSWILMLAVLGLLAIVAFYALQKSDRQNVQVASSVAVLPFANMSGPEQQYLCEGISEQIISALGSLPDVKVAARTSSFRFRNSDLDIREIADQLGVTAIVEGSVRRSGNTVRVSAQLVDAATGYQHWSDSFDGDIENTFELQERVSQALSQAIFSNPANSAKPMSPAPPKNFAAYDAYLQAQYALNRRTHKDLTRAIQLYEASLALDKNYAPSYEGLAYSHLLLPSYSNEDANVHYEKALAIIDRGIEINPAFEKMGASVRGFIHFKRGQWIESELAFKSALDNAYIEPTTYQWYSQMLASVGRLDRSVVMAQKAREADPLSPVANSRLAIAHLWLNQNEQARRFFDIANSLGLTTSVHKEAYTLLLLREGKFEEAHKLASEFVTASGSANQGFEQAFLAIGQPELQSKAVEGVKAAIEQQQISPRVAMLLYALLDAPEQAAASALSLAEQGELFEYEILFITELENVRSTSTFKTTVEKLDLPAYWQTANCEWNTPILQCTQ